MKIVERVRIGNRAAQLPVAIREPRAGSMTSGRFLNDDRGTPGNVALSQGHLQEALFLEDQPLLPGVATIAGQLPPGRGR